MAAFGIHVGNTCSCLAVYKDDRVEVVANDSGDRVTPSVVSYQESDIVVGAAAKQESFKQGENCVKNCKQYVGVKFNQDVVTVPMVTNVDGEVKLSVRYGDKQKVVSPKQIISLIYKKLIDTAQHHVKGDIHDAVITVPKCFTNQQRKEMRDAATEAGFNVLRVINECSAALLAYNIGQEQPKQSHLAVVYRCGGISCDASLVKVVCGMYTVIDDVTSYNNAGDAITNTLRDYLIQEFNRKWKCDISDSKRSVMKLEQAAERTKHVLSTMSTALCSVESLYDGIDFDVNVTRARLESLVAGTLRCCLQPLRTLLDRAEGVGVEEVSEVLLLGGTCRIPRLQHMVRDMFPTAGDTTHILHTAVASDECIAVGAATQASLLIGNKVASVGSDDTGGMLSTMEVPCLANDICVKVVAGACGGGGGGVVMNGAPPEPGPPQCEVSVVLPRHSIIPTRREQHTPVSSVLTPPHSPAPHVDVTVHVYELLNSHYTLLAQLLLSNISTASMITTTLHRKLDSLEVTCWEPASDVKEHVTILCQ